MADCSIRQVSERFRIVEVIAQYQNEIAELEIVAKYNTSVTLATDK